MSHFFVPPENIKDEKFYLKGSEAHHLLRVLRCKPGEEIRLFDGTGKTYIGEIVSMDKDEISGKIIEVKETARPKVRLNLYQCVPKGDRFDWLVEKIAELGVERIIPLITERSISKEISDNKLQRWKRLSAAASKQSGRPDIMDIGNPVEFNSALKMISNNSLSIIPWEGENKSGLAQILSNNKSCSEFNLFIGPEGGFSIEEIERAKKAGMVTVTLGQRILRSETAGIVAVALVLNIAGSELENW